MADNTVITIARQFGSGGHEIAEKLAEKLAFKFYDKELIAMSAKASGLSESLFEGIDERPTTSLLYSLVMGVQSQYGAYYRYGDILSPDGVYKIQAEVIKGLVDQSPCVIVGRCADYVLRNYEKSINVFIHADLEHRTERIMNLKSLNEKEAKSLITKTDKQRASFYNFYTNRIWGNVNNYHLSIDTTKITPDDASHIIIEYYKKIGL